MILTTAISVNKRKAQRGYIFKVETEQAPDNFNQEELDMMAQAGVKPCPWIASCICVTRPTS